jgi:hypothetical protein
MPTIGQFWEQLANVAKQATDEEQRDPKRYKRDIETRFMQIAYEKKKYRLVVGFRSGALDMFTLLGIPTISIGLRQLVGEDRHSKFATDPSWKRTNVQYDVPRHPDTGLVKGRGDSELYMSPYWKMRGTAPAPGEGAVQQGPVMPATSDKKVRPAPGPFHPVDLPTVRAGLATGIGKVTGNDASRSSKVVTRDDIDLLRTLPGELAEVPDDLELEKERQKDLRDWFERRAKPLADAEPHQAEAVATINRTDRERFEAYLARRWKDCTLKSQAKELDETAKKEMKDEKKRKKKEAVEKKAAEKMTQGAPASAAQPTQKKNYPTEHTEKILAVLREALPGRVELKDSTSDAVVQQLFGMTSKEFFAAFKELSKRHLVGHDDMGPFLMEKKDDTR